MSAYAPSAKADSKRFYGANCAVLGAVKRRAVLGRNPRHRSGTFGFGVEGGVSEKSPQQFRYLDDFRGCECEADNTVFVGHRKRQPKVGNVDSHENGLGLCREQAGNRVILDDCAGAQVQNIYHGTRVPRPDSRVQTLALQMLIQHNHGADTNSAAFAGSGDSDAVKKRLAMATASATASGETRPR